MPGYVPWLWLGFHASCAACQSVPELAQGLQARATHLHPARSEAGVTLVSCRSWLHDIVLCSRRLSCCLERAYGACGAQAAVDGRGRGSACPLGHSLTGRAADACRLV